jgi:hypothetical protein
MKIRVVGAELFRADGNTDMTQLIVVFFSILRTRLRRERNNAYWNKVV